MKKLYVLAFPVLFSLSVSAQQSDCRTPVVSYEESPHAEWHEDSLQVRFTVRVAGRLCGPTSLHIVPAYISGGDTIRYRTLSYFKPADYRYFRREQFVGETRDDRLVHLVTRRTTPLVTGYSQARPIPAAMRDGELRVLTYLRNCCGCRLICTANLPVTPPDAVAQQPVVAADSAAVPRELPAGTLPLSVTVHRLPLFERNVSFVQPAAEQVKERSEKLTVRINYPVNHWKVYAHYRTNGEELARIDRLLSPLAGDTATYRVRSARITGYASPEASYEHNKRLSELRAGAMRDYLRGRYGLAGEIISVYGAGEDWEGLRRAIDRSDMEDKYAALAIIDDYDIFDGRESRLMALNGGTTYRYMLENLFPPLRRMELELGYVVRSFGVEEAARLLASRPQDLSHTEIFDVAQARNGDARIRDDRDGYGREYDVALRYYPDDAAANINAASAALIRGDMPLAWKCLQRVQDDPRACIDLGIYCWMCGNTARARAYFLYALNTDPERASYNLEQLGRWSADTQNGK